jgi:hypothetical protein
MVNNDKDQQAAVLTVGYLVSFIYLKCMCIYFRS